MRTTTPHKRTGRTDGAPRRPRAERGFTLVELLMAMLVSTLIMIGTFAAFEMQNRTHGAQEQVVDMQQNIRAAMTVMTDDIRMAGHDADGTLFKENEPAITTAELGRITFVRSPRAADVDEDAGTVKGKCGDQTDVQGKCFISYRISGDYDKDANGVVGSVASADEYGKSDGQPSLVRCESLGMKCCDVGDDAGACANAEWEEVARGVEGLEFVYLSGSGVSAASHLWTRSDNPSDKDKKGINAVTVTLLMRSDTEDKRLSPADKLTPASNRLYGKVRNSRVWSANIKKTPHRRRLLYTTVQMRNTNMVKP